MKKSKEQIENELGIACRYFPDRYTGYFFGYVSKFGRQYWYYDNGSNIKNIENAFNISAKDIAIFGVNIAIFGWRRLQTDWRPINDLVIYDRFGSKLTWTEEPERSFEIKLTDAGQEHWELQRGRFDLPVSAWKSRAYRIHEMDRLFPVKKE